MAPLTCRAVRNGYDRYVLPKAGSHAFAGSILAVSPEIPSCPRKRSLAPLHSTFLIAVYAAGNYSVRNPPNGMSFIFERRVGQRLFHHSLQGVSYARSIFTFAASDAGDKSVCRRHHRRKQPSLVYPSAPSRPEDSGGRTGQTDQEARYGHA